MVLCAVCCPAVCPGRYRFRAREALRKGGAVSLSAGNDQHGGLAAAAAAAGGSAAQVWRPTAAPVSGMHPKGFRTSTPGGTQFGSKSSGADALVQAALAIAAQEAAAAAAGAHAGQAAHPAAVMPAAVPPAAAAAVQPPAAAAAAPNTAEPVVDKANMAVYTEQALKLSDELELLQQLISGGGDAGGGGAMASAPADQSMLLSPAVQPGHRQPSSPAADQPQAEAAVKQEPQGGQGPSGMSPLGDGLVPKQAGGVSPAAPGVLPGDVDARRIDQGLFL